MSIKKHLTEDDIRRLVDWVLESYFQGHRPYLYTEEYIKEFIAKIDIAKDKDQRRE